MLALEGSVVAAEEEAEEGVKWLKHYSSAQSILLAGDGDFSFSLALATAFGSGENLVATSLDAYATLKSKYNKAESNIMELKRMGATVLHGVDAKTMKLHTDLRTRRFDRIVFNFPHAGFNGKEDDVHMINMHKGLVRSFFYNSSHLLHPHGEIHVSHKIGLPYDIWDIKQLASESFLILVEKVGFQKEDYPGYNQKRGDGAKCDQPFILGACCTFKFRIGDIKKLNRVLGNMICSTSSLRGSNIHPDTTDRGAFHLFPPAWSPPRSVHPVHIGAIQPMLSIPEPLLNGLPTPADIPPPMSRITSTAHQQKLWYPQRPMFEPLGRSDYPYFAREYRMSLQREYEMCMEVMPVGTCSDYSAFLDHRLRESLQKQEWLRSLIALHDRQ